MKSISIVIRLSISVFKALIFIIIIFLFGRVVYHSRFCSFTRILRVIRRRSSGFVLFTFFWCPFFYTRDCSSRPSVQTMSADSCGHSSHHARTAPDIRHTWNIEAEWSLLNLNRNQNAIAIFPAGSHRYISDICENQLNLSCRDDLNNEICYNFFLCMLCIHRKLIITDLRKSWSVR